jgi:hypothetical protein
VLARYYLPLHLDVVVAGIRSGSGSNLPREFGSGSNMSREFGSGSSSKYTGSATLLGEQSLCSRCNWISSKTFQRVDINRQCYGSEFDITVFYRIRIPNTEPGRRKNWKIVSKMIQNYLFQFRIWIRLFRKYRIRI